MPRTRGRTQRRHRTRRTRRPKRTRTKRSRIPKRAKRTRRRSGGGCFDRSGCANRCSKAKKAAGQCNCPHGLHRRSSCDC